MMVKKKEQEKLKKPKEPLLESEEPDKVFKSRKAYEEDKVEDKRPTKLLGKKRDKKETEREMTAEELREWKELKKGK